MATYSHNQPVTFGIRDAKVGRWDGDGTYTGLVDCPGINQLTVTVNTITAEGEGDDSIQVLVSKPISATVSMQNIGISYEAYDVILGYRRYRFGTDGDYTSRMSFDQTDRPYFGLVALAKGDTGDYDKVIFVPKCKAMDGPSNIEYSYGNLVIPSMELMAIFDSNFTSNAGNDILLEMLTYQSAQTLALPPTNRTDAAEAYIGIV